MSFCAKDPTHRIIILIVKFLCDDYENFITDSLIRLSTMVKFYTPAVPNQLFREDYARFLPTYLRPVAQCSQTSMPLNRNDTHSCVATSVAIEASAAATLGSSACDHVELHVPNTSPLDHHLPPNKI